VISVCQDFVNGYIEDEIQGGYPCIKYLTLTTWVLALDNGIGVGDPTFDHFQRLSPPHL